ncbi:MAG: DUF3267 domain-containing protein [Clostridia bacterium]|nr:DUF3267 domain-containing protein [Clostridia bacterium]
MKTDNYTEELPEGYTLAKHVSAKDRKTTIIYTLLSFVPAIILFVAAFLTVYYTGGIAAAGNDTFRIVSFVVTCLVYLLYIVLHELVHGIVYKICTGRKLKFGLSMTYAFCGVPDVYVYRKAAVCAIIMPFAVFSVVFIGLTVGMYFVNPLLFIEAAIMLGLHLGGCVGDLHLTLLFAKNYRNSSTLMRDLGPEQFIYVKD